jgi:hypothetical protein
MVRIVKRVVNVIKQLLRYCYRFGLAQGLLVFLKTKCGYTGSIKIRGIKYPVALRAGTSDIPTFEQVFVQKHFDDMRFTTTFSSPLQVILDGGANIGLWQKII